MNRREIATQVTQGRIGLKLIHDEIDLANDLVKELLPASGRLYKYTGLSLAALSNIDNEMIWASNPSKFNDPYDSLFSLSESHIVAKAVDLLVEAGTIGWEEGEKAKLDNSISELIKGVNMGSVALRSKEIERVHSEVASKYSAKARELQSSLYVSCLSERKDSILMWSHYAAQHTGICIEYDFTKWPEQTMRSLFPVVYFNYFSAGLFKHKNVLDENLCYGELILMALIKYVDWSYEDEWRIVLKNPEGNVGMGYKLPNISAIYIGARTPKLESEYLIKQCRAKGIPTFQCTISESESDFKMYFSGV